MHQFKIDCFAEPMASFLNLSSRWVTRRSIKSGGRQTDIARICICDAAQSHKRRGQLDFVEWKMKHLSPIVRQIRSVLFCCSTSRAISFSGSQVDRHEFSNMDERVGLALQLELA